MSCSPGSVVKISPSKGRRSPDEPKRADPLICRLSGDRNPLLVDAVLPQLTVKSEIDVDKCPNMARVFNV
jgi:hypothetical protein